MVFRLLLGKAGLNQLHQRFHRGLLVRAVGNNLNVGTADDPQGKNTQLTMPNLDFQGVPTGIDIRKVVESGITPVINTGMAHKKPGVGQVGAGIVRAPMDCFTQALLAFAEAVGVK